MVSTNPPEPETHRPAFGRALDYVPTQSDDDYVGELYPHALTRRAWVWLWKSLRLCSWLCLSQTLTKGYVSQAWFYWVRANLTLNIIVIILIPVLLTDPHWRRSFSRCLQRTLLQMVLLGTCEFNNEYNCNYTYTGSPDRFLLPLTLREIAMIRFMNIITDKVDWHKKVSFTTT